MTIGAFIFIAIVAAVVWLAWWLKRADKCPDCKAILDWDFHGYRQQYSHCHRCGYCSLNEEYQRRMKQSVVKYVFKCGAKR